MLQFPYGLESYLKKKDKISLENIKVHMKTKNLINKYTVK